IDAESCRKSCKETRREMRSVSPPGEIRVRPGARRRIGAMEFTWTAEQEALREHAREVARSAVERYGRHNDSWINGYSKELAIELGALGWIGLTWPVEFGGGGRPPVDR